MAVGTADITTVMHFRKEHYKSPEANSKVANYTGPFTATLIFKYGSRLKSSGSQ